VGRCRREDSGRLSVECSLCGERIARSSGLYILHSDFRAGCARCTGYYGRLCGGVALLALI
jgi:hypothetical protein